MSNAQIIDGIISSYSTLGELTNARGTLRTVVGGQGWPL